MSELLRLNVDVIVTHGAAGALAAKGATTTVPIVIAAVGDILALGLVQSLSQPGGNVTGLTFFNPELTAKRLELLKEAVPGLAKAALLSNPANPINGAIVQAMEQTARSLKLEVRQFEARGPRDLEGAFAAMAKAQVRGLVVHEATTLLANAKPVADLATRQRLPVSGFPELAAAGGLMAYGISFPDMDRRAATFVGKILKGANPAQLPIERTSTFKLIINVRTAKALGLALPQSLLLRADEVMQ
jgi:putative ABC transport system substrate-binding protein